MEKKIGMSVQYDCTGMMESEQQEFQVKFKEETEFEGGMSSDFFMNYMRKGIEDLIKRFPSHYKAVNNCFKHYEEEKKLDTVNMGNQMISFRGMEISMDDIMLMYDEFKAMMGKVSKKFLEPIKLDKTLNIDIDDSRKQEYFGAMSFVSKMLKAKGEEEPIRMLFQAWLMSKNDFASLFKEIAINNTNFNCAILNLDYLVMPFDGVVYMFNYNKESKTIEKVFDSEDTDLEEFSKYKKYFEDIVDKDVCKLLKEWEDAITNNCKCTLDLITSKNVSSLILIDINKDLYNYMYKGVAA